MLQDIRARLATTSAQRVKQELLQFLWIRGRRLMQTQGEQREHETHDDNLRTGRNCFAKTWSDTNTAETLHRKLAVTLHAHAVKWQTAETRHRHGDAGTYLKRASCNAVETSHNAVTSRHNAGGAEHIAQVAPRLLGMVANNVNLKTCGRAHIMKLFTDLPMAPRMTSAST